MNINSVLLFPALLVMSALGAQAGELPPINVDTAGIKSQDQVATLNSGGVTASTSVTVDRIKWSATEHSPACAGTRVDIGGLRLLGGGDSECLRVCVIAPEGYESSAAFGIKVTTSHAWSHGFNPQWFANTGNETWCAFVKNWSSSLVAEAVFTIGVCPKGAGCARAAPPAAAPVPPAPVARRPLRPPFFREVR